MAKAQRSGSRSAGSGSAALFKLIKQVEGDGPLGEVYLFYGDEPYFSDRLVKALQQRVIDGNTNDFNYNVFIGGQNSGAEIVSVCESFPMMRPKRLVLVKDCQGFRADDWQAMATYLKNPFDKTCLVLLSSRKPRERGGGKAEKDAMLAMKKTAVIFECVAPKKISDLGGFIDAELRRLQKRMDARARTVLMELIGANLTNLVNALERLAIYIGPKDTIVLADVERCIAATKLEDVWDFQDFLALKNLGQALAALRKIQKNRLKTEDLLFLHGSITSHFRKLHQIASLLSRRTPEEEIKSIVGGHPFMVGKQIALARKMDLASFPAALDALMLADRQFKSSRVPNPLVLEKMVYSLCKR